MRRALRVGLWTMFCFVLALAGPAAALELDTSIDLDYAYSQENLGGDVKATTTYNQKYEIKYETALTTVFDFLGAVRLELQDAWHTSEANTSTVKPTLELQAKGAQAAAKIAYEGTVSSTDAYQESGDVTTYSTSLSADLEVTPLLWPEVKLKLQSKGSYDPWTTENTTDTAEFSARKDVYGVRLEFNLKLEEVESLLPERSVSNETQWSGKTTYKEVLWGGTEFELAYEIKEGYKDERTRGVFTGETEDYNQVLKTRLKNSLAINPKMTLGLSWEYQLDQDLLALDYDYKLKNKYLADMRWDFMPWLKVTGEAKRETERTMAAVGEDDEGSLSDGIKAGFDLSLISWLRLAGKAEYTSKEEISADSGGSVDPEDETKFELVAKHRLGQFWDLTVNANSSTKHVDNWISNRDSKVKAELKLKVQDLAVTPTYEASRSNEWEWGIDDPTGQKQSRDGKIKLEYKLQLIDLLAATFSHEYGVKIEDTLDDVLNFESTLQYSEDTRISLVITEIIRSLRLEGELERKASDTEDDADPELVELAYVLKLDWKLDELSLAASLKYNDKGDTYDDVSFNTKVGWKGERLEVTGEYQFDKIYAEETDEKRKLNLKLNYKF